MRTARKEGRKWRKRDARVRRLAEDVAGDSVGKLCMGGGVGCGGRSGKKDGWEEVGVKVGREGRNTVTGHLGKGSGTEKNVKGERGVNRGDADLARGGKSRTRKEKNERVAGDLVKRECLIGLLQRACSLMGPV